MDTRDKLACANDHLGIFRQFEAIFGRKYDFFEADSTTHFYSPTSFYIGLLIVDHTEMNTFGLGLVL